MSVERIIGVDFGTSTSVIRVKQYKDGKPIGERLDTKEVNFNGLGSMVPTLIRKKNDDPSVVYYGYEARNGKKNTTLYQSFKVDLENPDPEKCALARTLTEEFLSYMAKQYRAQSDGGHFGEAVDKEKTIISYPVKWSEETRRFMVEAAKKAGFPNVTGMDEAQAAIQAAVVQNTDYLIKHGLLYDGTVSTVLLIDMGAGTTDLVLCRYSPSCNGTVEILKTWPRNRFMSFDDFFGGQEIDMRFPGFFRQFMDKEAFERLMKGLGSDKFKSWKEEMVSPALLRKDTVSDFEALEARAELADIEIDDWCLDRKAFEEYFGDYLNHFPALINGGIDMGYITGEDVDLVILTGGHSQWYFVADMLAGKLPSFHKVNLPKIIENPQRIIPISRPQETVALGLVYSGIEVKFKSQEPVSEDKKKSAEPDIINTPVITGQSNTEISDSGFGSMVVKSAYWRSMEDKIMVVEGVLQGGPLIRGQSINVLKRKNNVLKGKCQVQWIERKSMRINIGQAGDPVKLTLNSVGNSIVVGDKISYKIESDISMKDIEDLNYFEFREVEGGYEIEKYLQHITLDCVKIPDTHRGKPIIGIGKRAFYKANGNQVILPKGCQYIGEEAFIGSKISGIQMSEGLKVIGEYAFLSNHSLKKVEIPASCHVIGNCAFKDCRNLEFVSIPGNSQLKHLYINTFYGTAVMRIKLPKAVQIVKEIYGISGNSFYPIWDKKLYRSAEKLINIDYYLF